MAERFGIILLDGAELIIRIYETNNKEWKLIHYLSKNLQGSKPDFIVSNDTIALTIADIFASNYSRHIAEWKICARNVSKSLSLEIQKLISLPIEYLTPAREQELLCKGMFTELW